jgi:hypothetical protein
MSEQFDQLQHLLAKSAWARWREEFFISRHDFIEYFEEPGVIAVIMAGEAPL